MVKLPRGMRFDRRAAARGAQVGFGRYVVDVDGFLPGGGGSTQLVWSLVATLGSKPGDVTLAGRLLGADSAAALLQPQLATPIPATTMTVARFARSGGRIEFRLPSLPAAIGTPARLELSLSASRRVRETIYHRIRVPTASGGSRIRRIRDHRLVSRDLLRTPARCTGSWSYELRAGGQASTGRIPCLAPLTP